MWKATGAAYATRAVLSLIQGLLCHQKRIDLGYALMGESETP